MASFKTSSATTNSSNKLQVHQNDLRGRLQRIATGIFVAGFAGTIAASRMLPPAHAGSHKSSVGDALFITNNTSNHANNNAKVHAAMYESKQLMQDLIQTIDKARLSNGAIKEESMMRARHIARSLASINRFCQANSINDIKLFGEGSCAAPAAAALVHLSTGQYSLSSGIVIRVQGIGGTEQFSFASGTTKLNIINAINSFSKTLGIEAGESMDNPARIEVRSTEVGADGIVRMWGNAVVFSQATGGPPLADLKDYGKNSITLQNISK